MSDSLDISDAIHEQEHIEEIQETQVSENDVPENTEQVEESVQDSIQDAYANPNAPAVPPVDGSESVPGFNLVQATGLTDTSIPAVTKTELPSYVTASPIEKPTSPTLPPMERFGSPSPPPPPKDSKDVFDPLSEVPRSKIFAQRMDVHGFYLLSISI